MSKRGVVIYPQIDVAANIARRRSQHARADPDKRVHIEYTLLDAALLRMYVLYWDLIDWPQSNLIPLGPHENISTELDLLAHEGILRRTNIRFLRKYLDAVIPYAVQAIAFMQNNERPGEDWSIGQRGFQLSLPPEYMTIRIGIEIELYQALPVPSGHVGIEDVLDFKRKRMAELLRFRHAMDGFYLQVIQSKDIPRAKTRAIDEIGESVVALNKVMEESRFPTIRPTVKVQLNISQLIAPFLVFAEASRFGLTPEVSATLGLAAAAAMTLKVDFAFAPKAIPETLRDYAYLSHIETELS